jgi:flagellar biosynthesis/type III secretory pathway protein FliH
MLGRYAVEPFGIETNTFTFPVIRLWEFLEAILAGEKKYLGLLPLLLEFAPKPNVKLLKQQRELMDLIKDRKRFDEVLALSALIASRYFAKKIIDNIYKENTTMKIKQLVKEFPILEEPVQELLKEAKITGLEMGRKEGREEGREEGAFSAFQQDLLDLLEARLGTLDKKTLAAVRSIQDIKLLRTLFKKSLRLKSPEALREVIAAHVRSNGRRDSRRNAVRKS